jgi:hypothetical protein
LHGVALAPGEIEHRPVDYPAQRDRFADCAQVLVD